MRGDQHELDPRRSRGQRGRQVETALLGEVDVDERHVWLELGREPESLRRGGRDAHHIEAPYLEN